MISCEEIFRYRQTRSATEKQKTKMTITELSPVTTILITIGIWQDRRYFASVAKMHARYAVTRAGGTNGMTGLLVTPTLDADHQKDTNHPLDRWKQQDKLSTGKRSGVYNTRREASRCRLEHIQHPCAANKRDAWEIEQ